MSKLFTVVNKQSEKEEVLPTVSFEEAVAGLEALTIDSSVDDMYLETLETGITGLEALGDIVTRLNETEEVTPALLVATQAHVNFINKSLGDNTEIVGIENFDEADIIVGLEEKKESILTKLIALIRRVASSTLSKIKDNAVSKYVAEKLSAVWKVLANIPSSLMGKKIEVDLGFKDVKTLERTCATYKETMDDIGKLLKDIDVNDLKVDFSNYTIFNNTKAAIYFSDDLTNIVDNVKFGKNKAKVKVKKAKYYEELTNKLGIETGSIDSIPVKFIKTPHPAEKVLKEKLAQLEKANPSDVKVAKSHQEVLKLLNLFNSYATKVPTQVLRSLGNIASSIKEEERKANKDKKKKG